MLYQYNAENYEKPIIFCSPNWKSYLKSYDARDEYDVNFNLETIVNEYDNGEVVILIVGNPTEKVKSHFKSIISNIKLITFEGDGNYIYFRIPDKKQ